MPPKPTQSQEQLRRTEATEDDGELKLSPDPERAAEQLEAAAIGEIRHAIDVPLSARVEAVDHLGGDPAKSLRIVEDARSAATERYGSFREEIELVVHPEDRQAKPAQADEVPFTPDEEAFFAGAPATIEPEQPDVEDQPSDALADEPRDAAADAAMDAKIAAMETPADFAEEAPEAADIRAFNAERQRIVQEVLGSRETEPRSIEEARQQQLYLMDELHYLSGTISDLHGEEGRDKLKAAEDGDEIAAYKAVLERWASKNEMIPVLDEDGKPINDSEGNPIMRPAPPLFNDDQISQAREHAALRRERATWKFYGYELGGKAEEKEKKKKEKKKEKGAKTSVGVVDRAATATASAPQYLIQDMPFALAGGLFRAGKWTVRKAVETTINVPKLALAIGTRQVGARLERRRVLAGTKNEDGVPTNLAAYMGNTLDTEERLQQIEAIQKRIIELQGTIRNIESGAPATVAPVSETAGWEELSNIRTQAEGESAADYRQFVEDRSKRIVDQMVLRRMFAETADRQLAAGHEAELERLLTSDRPIENLFLTDTADGTMYLNDASIREQFTKEQVDQQRRLAQYEVLSAKPLREAAKLYATRHFNDKSPLGQAMASDHFEMKINQSGEISIAAWVITESAAEGDIGQQELRTFKIDGETSSTLLRALDRGDVTAAGLITEAVLKNAFGEAEPPAMNEDLEQNPKSVEEFQTLAKDFERTTKPQVERFAKGDNAVDQAPLLSKSYEAFAANLRKMAEAYGRDDAAFMGKVDTMIETSVRLGRQYAEYATVTAAVTKAEQAVALAQKTLTAETAKTDAGKSKESGAAAKAALVAAEQSLAQVSSERSTLVAAITENTKAHNKQLTEFTGTVQAAHHTKVEKAFRAGMVPVEKSTFATHFAVGETIKLPDARFGRGKGHTEWKVIQAERGMYVLERQDTKPGEVALRMAMTDGELDAWIAHTARVNKQAEQAKLTAQPDAQAQATSTNSDTIDLPTAASRTPDAAAPVTAPEPATIPAAPEAAPPSQSAAPEAPAPTATETAAQPDSAAAEAPTIIAEQAPTLVPEAAAEAPTLVPEAEPVAAESPLVNLAEAAEAAPTERAESAAELAPTAVAEAPTVLATETAPTIIIEPSPEPTTPEVTPNPEEAPTERAA